MYLLSVLAIILCFVFVQLVNPYSIMGFVDATCILLLVVLVVPIMISAGLLKDLNNGIRLILGKKKETAMLELKRAKLAVDTTMRVSVCSSLFVTMMEVVVLLHNMSDPAMLGPMISLCLLSLLYAMIINLLLLPIRAKLEQRILEYIPSCPEREEETPEERGRREEAEKNGKAIF